MPPVAAHAYDASPGRSPKRRLTAGTPVRRKRSTIPWRGLFLGSGAVTAALVFLAREPEPAIPEISEHPAIEEAEVRAPQPTWEAIVQPATLFSLDAPELQGLPSTYEARRDGDAAREDTVTFGSADAGAAPYARLVVHQASQPEEPTPSFFVDLARRAADAGLAVTRSTPAIGLRTKFGFAEAADLTLAGSAERACLGVRLSHADAGFGFDGWLCGAGSQAPSPRQLACLIDGLSLRADEPALKLLFAHAERKRDGTCAPPARVAEAAKPAPPPRNSRRR